MGWAVPGKKVGGKERSQQREGLSRDSVSDLTQWHLVLAESKVDRLDVSD